MIPEFRDEEGPCLCTRMGSQLALKDATSPGSGVHEFHRVVRVLQHDCPHTFAIAARFRRLAGEAARAREKGSQGPGKAYALGLRV